MSALDLEADETRDRVHQQIAQRAAERQRAIAAEADLALRAQVVVARSLAADFPDLDPGTLLVALAINTQTAVLRRA